MKHFFVMICVVVLGSCSHDQKLCISFVERSCNSDPWALSGLGSDQREDRLAELRVFLDIINLDADELTFEKYEGNVCYACNICPGSYQISMKIDEENLDRLMELNPLELMFTECD